MAQILTKQQNIPNFNLITPYSENIWRICEWDIYKNSDEEKKAAWIARTNSMKNTMDFTLCKNEFIREEVKYFSYYLLNEKKVNLRTFAEYIDRYKLFFLFVNNKPYTSVLDIDAEDYATYISNSHKAVIDNGSMLIGNKIVPSKKRNRIISFLDNIKKVIFIYTESDKSVFERDVWKGNEIDPNSTSPRNFDFTGIAQPLMKEQTKMFIRFKLPSVALHTATAYLHSIRIFCHWLYEYDDSIDTFAKVNREIIEDYFLFLRVESDFSQRIINRNILNLSVMFEYGLVTDNNNFPDYPLFLNTDYAFKTKHLVKYYTPDEIVSIFSIIKFLPKVYGKILMVLHHSGLRVSEVLHLSTDSLKEENGKPYINAYMYKTERYNKVPLDNNTYQIIKQENEYNKKHFPNAKYVFLNKNGTSIKYGTFMRNIKKVLVKHNVLGHDGNPLVFGTHRFRTTKATELISMGVDPQKAADMLGQKSLSALSYYATATHASLSEYMQEYLRKESILINSIGKMDEFVIEDYENAIPLCNGWCCKPTELGVCDKANACLTCSQFRPSMRHLTNYQLQLAEIESSLAVAKQNGYTRIIEKCEQEKKALEDIILRLEEMLNEKKH